METNLKAALGLSVVKRIGNKGGGCISEGNVYETENGLLFVKTNSDSKAHIMFKGEVEGLKAIEETKSVRVPNPITILDLNTSRDKHVAIVMEYVEMSSLASYAEKLGELLAKMHLFNKSLRTSSSYVQGKPDEDNEKPQHIKDFGFHTTTCCGAIPQNNSWKSDWIEFYAQQRLEHQIQLVEAEYGDREAMELWSELCIKLPVFFKDVEITPALLHGDLWSGNAAQTVDGPVIFDPAVFYGHTEYDLAIAEMFGGFPRSFYNAYHSKLLKQPGFEKRQDLYKLFQSLWWWISKLFNIHNEAPFKGILVHC